MVAIRVLEYELGFVVQKKNWLFGKWHNTSGWLHINEVQIRKEISLYTSKLPMTVRLIRVEKFIRPKHSYYLPMIVYQSYTLNLMLVL